MNAAQYQRATELFEAALKLPADRRAAFLVNAPQEDAAVMKVVERMLAQHDVPAFDLDSAALTDGLAKASLAYDLADDASALTIRDRIGQFRIIGVLGEGGMSVVYRAEQEFPKREVALKVLRSGSLSPAGMRRFRTEVETLAKLSHPNIAQVYQAGSYEGGAEGEESRGGERGGRPYFAMELVEGPPLTEYAQRRNLGVADRIRLMIDVCRALQHAHLRGVIHRDLKPANILVHTSSDAGRLLSTRGVPKVLDFGIARATDLDVTRATLAAETGQIIGTLPYMSPEQLAGDATHIDLRSDVYAMGVVLFELLTGELPHAISGKMSLPQTAQALANAEPRRLGTVNRSLRGELDVIVAAALEHDRERRYQSADALADDLQAHLDHRPIRAKPPGPIIRARKWLRRHPTTAATMAVAITAALVIATLVTLQINRTRLAAENELASLMRESTQAVQAFADDLDAATRRDIDLVAVRNQLYRYNPPEQALALEQREQDLLRQQNEHEASLQRIIDALNRAQRLGAPENDVRRLMARLYLARVREAEAAGDRFARGTYLELVRQHDPDDELAGQMVDRFNLVIRSDPLGAEAHLFRMIEQTELLPLPDGEPRLVPVPFRGIDADAPTPGEFALRVVDGRDVLNDDDIVLSVNGCSIRDGVFVITAPSETGLQPLDRLIQVDDREVRGVYDAHPPLPGVNAAAAAPLRTWVFERPAASSQPAHRVSVSGKNLESLGIRAGDAAQTLHEVGGPTLVWRRGKTSAHNLPPGLILRMTAKPMLICDQSRVGATPVESLPIERGRYIVLLLKDGYEPLRIPLDIQQGGMIDTMALTAWRLLPRGSTPAPRGFVRACHWTVPDAEPFWVMEREVTLGEYLEFLNDPETLARIDASPTPILYPRSGSFMECGRERAANGSPGRFTTGAEMRSDDPVLAVSWYDATEYVRWRNQRARELQEIPENMEYGLPTHTEWLAVWACGDKNQYPWGSHYRSHWTCSNYARAQPAPEPVMRFPIDESDIGVYDLAGSVAEWLDAWWIEERDQREVAGGSWGHGGGSNYRDMFMLYGQNGQTASVTNGTVGFRLVLRKRATP